VTQTAGTPLRAAIYTRISKDKAGDEHGVGNQLMDAEQLVSARGMTLVRRFCDNDLSAFSGVRRPDYEALMTAAGRGEFDAIVVWQSSRLWRTRTERAAAIKVLQKASVSVIACKGPSLDMSTAYGRAMAGLLGEFDTMESEVKSERQQSANEKAAKAGKPRTACPRSFGWLDDRITADPQEGPAVADACRALLAGGTVSGVCRDWTTRGVRPVQSTSGRWTRASVVTILRNPRIAGISTYRGAEVGTGDWQPLVSEETFRAVSRLLSDPSRKPAQGVRTMLGGLARCRCGNHMTANMITRGAAAWQTYRCNPSTRDGRPGPHVSVRCAPVDEAVGALVLGRLTKPDVVNLVAPTGDSPRVRDLQDEAQAIRSRLGNLGPLYMAGQITEADLISGRAWGDARLTEIAAELADLGRESVLAPLLAAQNVMEAWATLGTDRKRAVVAALMTVTLHPAGRGARVFDPDIIVPGWHELND
jgi:DNA invertase Pin-like site-specific DNA recombinase